MNFRDSNQGSQEGKYISKKVMINGQYVTLYSSNGQTWVSSPEDIPALMERLDNARITLNTAEKVAEGEGSKAAKPEAKKTEDQDPKVKEQPERVLQTKYRVKGPKPRPILRQDGLVIKGTPIVPISASSTVLSFSSDQEEEIEDSPAPKKVQAGKESNKKEALPAKREVGRNLIEKSAKGNVVTATKPQGSLAKKNVQVSKQAAPKSTKKASTKTVARTGKTTTSKAAVKGTKPAPKAPTKKAVSSKKATAKGKAKRK
jgi:hypothetical protein